MDNLRERVEAIHTGSWQRDQHFFPMAEKEEAERIWNEISLRKYLQYGEKLRLMIVGE